MNLKCKFFTCKLILDVSISIETKIKPDEGVKVMENNLER